jgi:predicted ATPase
VPATLTGVLQARLDSLPHAARDMLQRASVVGRIFWDGAVAALSASEPPTTTPVDVAPLLDEVRKRELVFRREHSSFAGSQEYIFKHLILHDVTYETVLLRLRRVYHKQVARWLEANAGERLPRADRRRPARFSAPAGGGQGHSRGILAGHGQRAEGAGQP